MQKIFLKASGLACAAIIAFALAACKADDAGNKTDSSQPTAAEQPAQAAATNPGGTRRTTVAELQQLLERGEAVVVDVRAKEQYEQGHIKGATSLPSGEISSRIGELPKDKLIVFYCA